MSAVANIYLGIPARTEERARKILERLFAEERAYCDGEREVLSFVHVKKYRDGKVFVYSCMLPFAEVESVKTMLHTYFPEAGSLPNLPYNEVLC